MSNRIETILNILGDIHELSPEPPVSDELSEAELMLVSAARHIPSYHEFLDKAGNHTKNDT